MYAINKLILIIFLFILSCSYQENHLPDIFGNYKLSEKITGDKAKDILNNLHFNKVTERGNQIGIYTHEQNVVTIYLTSYDTPEMANQMYDKMTNKISSENSVFIGGNYLTINGKKTYRCYGLGFAHFVLTLESDLIWISLPAIDNEKILISYLDHIE